MNQKANDLLQTRVYKGSILDVVNQCVHFRAGKDINYEVVHRPSIVIIIPRLSSGKLLLVHQYRAALNQYIWEFPGGSVEKGELLIDAAKRELEEEVGYKADTIQLIREFYTSPQFSDEKVYLYIAKKLTLSQTNPQEKELISVHELKISELKDKYQKGEIVDAKTLVAYHVFMNRTCGDMNQI